MINICFLVDAPYAGGAERYVSLLARALDKKYFNATVVLKSGGNLGAFTEELEEDGIAVHPVKMDLPYSLADFILVTEHIRALSPHIAHINMPGPYDGQMGILAPLSRLAGAQRVVVTEHLPMVEKLWKRAALKRLSYNWVDRVITVCRANVTYLLEKQNVDSSKISVVQNALPLDFGTGDAGRRKRARNELDLPEEAVAVCIVGSLIERKGHALLIESLVSIRDLPWRLVVIGEGMERGRCESMLARAGLGDRALFSGFLSRSDVERLLPGMDILAMPSFIEASPYAVLEAMACGLPVVASRIFGIPEVALDGETALLVDPGNKDELSSALKHLIENEELRRRLGENGRKRFENNFLMSRQADAMQSIYLEELRLVSSMPGSTYE